MNIEMKLPERPENELALIRAHLMFSLAVQSSAALRIIEQIGHNLDFFGVAVDVALSLRRNWAAFSGFP